MPPRKKTARTGETTAPPRRSARTRRKSPGGIPNVYHDMLREAAASERSAFRDGGRATKRVRVTEPEVSAAATEEDLFESMKEANADMQSTPPSPARLPQTAYDDFASSDESDMDFEDVELEPVPGPAGTIDEDERSKPLEIDLSKSLGSDPKPTVRRRKPATSAERRHRLDVHKWHLLSLIAHVHFRNKWCDDEEVHATLKPLVPRKTISLLHLDESKPQYARNHAFTEAIKEVSLIWKTNWETTARGMRRAYWAESPDATRTVR